MWWRRDRAVVYLFTLRSKIGGGKSEMAAKRHMCEGDRPQLKKPASTNFWGAGLKTSIDDPKLHVFADDKIVIIKDKYPKVPN